MITYLQRQTYNINNHNHNDNNNDNSAPDNTGDPEIGYA